MNIILTEAAINHVRQAAAHGESLRMSLHRGGCAGAKYRLTLEAGQQDDIALSFAGFTLFVAAADAELLDGTVVDCVEDLTGRRVTFSNPRETARCGCGQSVSISA